MGWVLDVKDLGDVCIENWDEVLQVDELGAMKERV
jgi:hypothetical protein